MIRSSSLLPAILWIAAFICSLYPINDWEFPLFGAATILLFGWSFLMLTRQIENGWTVPRSPVLLFAGLFWLLLLLSVFWSDIKPASIISFCMLSFMPLTFFTGVLRGGTDYFKIVFAALGVIFAVLAIWAIIQFFFLNAYFLGQAQHPLHDPSSLGALFSLGLFCALGFILLAPSRKARALAVGLSSLIVCGLLSTVARGPIFAFIPAVGIFLFLLWPQVKARKASLLIICIVAAGFYGLTLTNAQKKFDIATRLAETVTATVTNGDPANSRLAIWRSTIDMIRERPLLGTGTGTFALYYPEHRSPDVQDNAYLAHNDPLQFWAELGVFGPLLFYAFAFAAMLRMRASWTGGLNKPEYLTSRIIAVSFFCGLGAMAIQSHVTFNHYNASILLMNGLMLSVWFIATGRTISDNAKLLTLDPAPAGVGKILLALPFVMVGWIVISIVAGEHFASKARDNLFAGDMTCLTPAQEESKDCFLENVNRANRVSLGLNSRAYLFAVNVPMSILEIKSAKFSSDEEARALYDQVAGYMDQVLAINPRDASAHYYLGRVQALVPKTVVPADRPGPEQEFTEALRLDPLHLGARMALYDLYTKEGRDGAARLAVLEPGLKFRYQTTEAMNYYAALARLYLELGDYGKAKEIMLRARSFSVRSDYSRAKQNNGITGALMGGDVEQPKF